MKIFNKENNEEVAYVQKGDLGFMMHSCDGVPAAFLDEFFNNIVIINGDNRREFVRFNNPKIVKWLKDQDWIIDYRNYVNLSEDSIMKKGRRIGFDLNETIEKHNSLPHGKERAKEYSKYELLGYKFDAIKEFLWYKQGHIKYDIPLVPDSEGFKLDSGEKYDYMMQASLDPHKILLYRKDGKPLSKTEDDIPTAFIDSGLSIAATEGKDNNTLTGDYVVKTELSEDEKYLVFVFHNMENENKKEVKKENVVKRKIKSLFNKKTKGE